MGLSTPSAFRAIPPLALAFSLLLSAAPSGGAFVPVGVSEVGAQRFDNEALTFFIPEQSDHFAFALAAGDFDGDGADDLATGIPFDQGEVGSGCVDCGIVIVRYGVAGIGFVAGPAETVLYQGFAGSLDPAELGDRFGAALAASDFNGDGYDDLAVGIPFDWSTQNPYGAVQIHYGSADGIETVGSEILVEWLPWTEIESCAAPNAQFGAALAAGNFDGDLFADLAIGEPFGCLAQPLLDSPGKVFVAHGSAQGLLPLTGYGISQRSEGIFGDPAPGERFGAALAAGDFDGDGRDDLGIGVPNEGDNGALYVVMGSPFGLIYANSVFWAPGALGLEPESGDRLASALAAADFDGDGHDDLAIGDPSEDLGATNLIHDAGSVSVAYGSPAGFDLSRTVTFTQGLVEGDPFADREGDQFGWALAAGDFDRDGHADLVVGRPGEDVGASINTGAATILMGAADAGLGARIGALTPGGAGVPGDNAGHQDFARTLAIGDFDGDGHADLVIGAAWYDSPAIVDAGDEVVLYGSLFSDGFETFSTERWSSSVP
jgi:hypothetical protein